MQTRSRRWVLLARAAAHRALWLALLACCVGGLTLLARRPARGDAAPGTHHPRPLRETAAFGAYARGLPYFPWRQLPRLERTLGQRLQIASGFVDWDYILGEPRDRLLAADGARRLLYSWEPHCSAPDRCIAFRDVVAGRLDGYLEQVAASMRRFPHLLYVRPWAELNAHWSPYLPGSGRPSAGSVEEFKQAWRYLFSFFRQRQVHNLRFVFNVDAALEPGNADIRAIWPGAAYVDVLGIDGYNWGESGRAGGNAWLEFEAIFGDMYQLLTSLHESAPVWICEFGSKEPRKSDGSKQSPAPADPAHSKARWIANFMASTAFPRIQALVYYNAYTPERDNQRDFRLESSRESLQAIRHELRLQRAGAARAEP